MREILALLAMACLLFGCTGAAQFSTAAAPSSGNCTTFGNNTTATACIGGSAGIGNFTGQLIGRNMTLTNGTMKTQASDNASMNMCLNITQAGNVSAYQC